MKKKKFFKKKTTYFTLYIFLIIIFLISIIILYYLKFQSRNYFVITDSLTKNYIIPLDRGGEKVKNIDKKVLHLNQNEKNEPLYNDVSKINYSIQLFASQNYDEVREQLNKYIIKSNYIYNKKDFFTIIFSTDIGSEYLLLYKNFNSREEALTHCVTYLFQLDQCLVVDTKLFNN